MRISGRPRTRSSTTWWTWSTCLSGLGCRIGELLALDWTKVEEEAGTLAIEGTVIRVPGPEHPLRDAENTRPSGSPSDQAVYQ